MAHRVGRRIHAVRHDGTVAQDVVGLPIIGRIRAGLIVAGMGIAHGEVTEEDDGGDSVVGVVHPNAVVNACGGILQSGCVAEDIGGTYAKVIVFIPIGVGARADVAVGGLVFGTDHGLTEASRAVAEVARQTAVAHG